MPLTTRDTASMLTTKEVAALLQIDRNTLFEWRKAGRIKAVKFGTASRSMKKPSPPDSNR